MNVERRAARGDPLTKPQGFISCSRASRSSCSTSCSRVSLTSWPKFSWPDHSSCRLSYRLFGRRFVALFAVAGAAWFLAAAGHFVDGRPSAAFGLFFGHAALFVALFNVLGLSLLFVRVFGLVTPWHLEPLSLMVLEKAGAVYHMRSGREPQKFSSAVDAVSEGANSREPSRELPVERACLGSGFFRRSEYGKRVWYACGLYDRAG